MKFSYAKTIGKSALGVALVAFFISSCEKSTQTVEQTGSSDKPKAASHKVESVDTPPAPAAINVTESVADDEEKTSEVVSTGGGVAAAEKGEAASAEQAFEVVTDPASLRVEEGGDRPVKGDKIYTYQTLPKDGCGTYWVRESDGSVARIAICNDAAHSH